MDIGHLLSTAAGGFGTDPQARAEAQKQLSDAAIEHYPEYIGLLAQTLATDSNPQELRILAALELKNKLTAKDSRVQSHNVSRYLSLAGQDREKLREVALSTVQAPEMIARAGAQLIAAIANIDLPRGEWPELPQFLVSKTTPDQPADVKKACLQVIGFICEGADPSNPSMVAQMDGLLTATIQGAQANEPNPTVRLTALNALVNSLEFIGANFAREAERNVIMGVVCEATSSANPPELQSAGFGALGRIMALYYEYMATYMQQALFTLTLEGMRGKNESVVCMAIEFWSTVCEEEIAIQLNALQGYNGETNYQFAQGALEYVLPVLFELLPRKDDIDDDEWSASMAAGACLQLFSQDVKDAIVQPTLQFISTHIQSPEWANREAAVMAFGSILDGPDPTALSRLIKEALGPLLNLMSDSSSSVRDTVAWCLGRAADTVVDAIGPEELPLVVQTLTTGIGDVPKVATNCCWAIMNLTEQLSPVPLGQNSPMSPFYAPVMEALVQASNRTDNDYSARTSAYEALSTMVIYSPEDTQPLVLTLSGTVIERLQNTLQLQTQIVSIDDRSNLDELQINLLGLLTNIIRRIGPEVSGAADQLMGMLLHFLQNRLPNSVVDEDVFIAVGAVAGAINEQFNRFVQAFFPFIVNAIKEPEFPACRTAVGLVADIAHAIGPQLAAYTDIIMAEFVNILQSNEVSRDLKLIIISCIGDIGASIGPAFEKYLPNVIQILQQGAQLEPDPNMSEDTLQYISSLREAILDGYVGIFAGLREQPQSLRQYIPSAFDFLQLIAADGELLKSEQTLRSAVGLIGDIASMYPGGEFAPRIRDDWVTNIIKRAREKDLSQATRNTAKWARELQKRQALI